MDCGLSWNMEWVYLGRKSLNKMRSPDLVVKILMKDQGYSQQVMPDGTTLRFYSQWSERIILFFIKCVLIQIMRTWSMEFGNLPSNCFALNWKQNGLKKMISELLKEFLKAWLSQNLYNSILSQIQLDLQKEGLYWEWTHYGAIL